MICQNTIKSSFLLPDSIKYFIRQMIKQGKLQIVYSVKLLAEAYHAITLIFIVQNSTLLSKKNRQNFYSAKFAIA